MLVKKKPVVVQADQWKQNGDHPNDQVGKWVSTGLDNWHEGYYRREGAVVGYFHSENPEQGANKTHVGCGYLYQQHGWVETLEGGHIVCPGDWIITGTHNEYYPIKPEIFQETYEEVSNA